jgi:cytochrome oxidase Cu insertion factor (SCO1/SenC/PrrC family)
MRKQILIGLLVLIFLVSGCMKSTQQITQEVEREIAQTEPVNWLDTELKDVVTGETFKISDFKGKPILLESFAVWCPICLKQQFETQESMDLDDNVVHISIDTDPNEDEDIVKQHVSTYGFDWYFAVAPVEMTRALVDEFGFTIVNAPSAPVLLICEDQTTRFLPSGIKTASELSEEVNKGC